MEQKYVMAAIDAALKAGKEILSIYEDPASDFEIERKADNSPLTIADRKAHEAIVAILDGTPFPVLSEEGKHLGYETRREWNSVPVMGVIYVPVRKELYFAVEGVGAYKCSGIIGLEDDGVSLEQLIKESDRIPLEDVRERFIVVASRSHLSPETEEYIADLKRKYGSVELISSGSSIKICLVAEGKADVYPRFAPTMEWDTAAGHAIARVAGMEVYQAGKDEPLRYNKKDLLNPWFIVEPKREH